MSLFGSLYRPQPGLSNTKSFDHVRPSKKRGYYEAFEPHGYYESKFDPHGDYELDFEARHRPGVYAAPKINYQRSKPDPGVPLRRSQRLKELAESKHKAKMPPRPPGLYLDTLPSEIIDQILAQSLGFCTLRRSSAALIATLPTDPNARFAAVRALPRLPNNIGPHTAPYGTISFADRIKYRRFRQRLSNFNVSHRMRAHLVHAEKTWLTTFPLDLVDLAALLDNRILDLRTIGAGFRGFPPAYQGRPRKDLPLTSIALALYPLDMLFHRRNQLNRLEPRHGVPAEALHPHAGFDDDTLLVILLRQLPESVRTITLVASYFTTTTYDWPGGAPPWEAVYRGEECAREGYGETPARHFVDWIRTNRPGTEVVVARVPTVPGQVGEDEWDTWAWI